MVVEGGLYLSCMAVVKSKIEINGQIEEVLSDVWNVQELGHRELSMICNRTMHREHEQTVIIERGDGRIDVIFAFLIRGQRRGSIGG